MIAHNSLFSDFCLAMAATMVPHVDCHIFSFASGPDDQRVCTALAGETVTIKRTEKMVASQKVYDVKYSAEGWGVSAW